METDQSLQRLQVTGATFLSRGFPPVSSSAARVLILGSLPGQRSLAERRYYAQPRNAFWSIMGELCRAGPEVRYDARLERLRAAGIALWDVLAAGERPGSLDSAIVRSTIVANDFVRFYAAHPAIGLVCFNGAKAAELYRRDVLPDLDARAHSLPRHTLPSTSPANASVSYRRKLEQWSAVLAPALGTAGRPLTTRSCPSAPPRG
jgi:double-stranded uracil-DNA glycosylase